MNIFSLLFLKTENITYLNVLQDLLIPLNLETLASQGHRHHPFLPFHLENRVDLGLQNHPIVKCIDKYAFLNSSQIVCKS